MVIGFRFNRFDRRVNLVSRIFMLFFFPTHICRRGIDLPSLLCPIREGVVESSSHLFFYCSLLVSVIFQVYRCRDFPAPSLSSYADWLVWLKTLRFPVFAKWVLEGVFLCLLVDDLGLQEFYAFWSYKTEGFPYF